MSDTNPDTGQVPEWTLGWRMKRALAHAGMTAEEMADELGYATKTMSRWTNDKGAPPRSVILKRWAMKCGVPYAWLIGQDDDGPTGVGVRVSGWNVPAASVTPLRLAS